MKTSHLFTTGDIVRCVDARGRPDTPKLHEGRQYVICEVFGCGAVTVAYAGHSVRHPRLDRDFMFSPSRFVPVGCQYYED